MVRLLLAVVFAGLAVAPRTQNEPSAAAARLVAAKKSAVVHVYVRIENEGGRFGKDWFKDEDDKRSGAIVDPSGLVLTHWSCVGEAFGDDGQPKPEHSVQVELVDGPTLPAKLVAHDAGADLALVAIEPVDGEPFEFFELADSSGLMPGHPVVAIGHPDGKDLVVFAGCLARASGGVELGSRALSAGELLLSDASIRPQDNGGPLVDLDGRLAGLCNSKYFVRPTAEPTKEDLEKPNFGVAVSSVAIAKALRPAFTSREWQNATLRNLPKRDSPPSVSELAVARVRDAIVAVHIGEELPELGLLDPYASRRHDGRGSGVCVDSTGLVLTNAHIVRSDDQDVWVTFLDGKTYKADVLDKDAASNIALLRIASTEEFPFVELGDSDQAIKGEQVLAVGNPRGTALSVGVGVVSAMERRARVGGNWMPSEGLLQIDAPVDGSNTGGAVVDGAGSVIAIINAGEVEEEVDEGEEKKDTNIGFAIPIERIRKKFRDDFDMHAGANESVVTARASTPEELALRESRLTKMVAASAESLVNVYVAVELPKPDTFDPFAEDEARFMMMGQGSGVIIDPSGLALTNWHVVDRGDLVTVRTGTDQTYQAKVLSTSRVDDLALLQLELPDGETVRAVELADSDAVPPGTTVVAIGNPYGHSNTVTAGVLSAVDQAINIKGRAREFKGLIQTDAAINPGNSGGALLDLEGRLVGINSAGANSDAEVGYAIPSNYVREKFHSKLLSAEKLGSSYLGMIVVDDEDKGPVVRSVNRFGPAARAGFQVGDVVRRVGASAIKDRVEFVRVTLGAVAGEPIPIELDRDGTTLTLEPTPISARAWRVFRQTGIEVEVIDFADEAERIRDAQIAMFRHYTGSADGEPTLIERTAVRVVQVRPSEVEAGLDLAPGDLLMGIETRERLIGGGETTKLIGFHGISGLGECFDQHATKEDHRWPLFVYRDGEIRQTSIRIERVY